MHTYRVIPLSEHIVYKNHAGNGDILMLIALLRRQSGIADNILFSRRDEYISDNIIAVAVGNAAVTVFEQLRAP